MGQEIRTLDLDGIRTAVEWARREGWNPGLRDAEAFAAADPDGFSGLYVDGQLAATISLVTYSPEFAFLGFYIASPEFRGQGLGLQLWTAALARCTAATIGLDGVKAQQPAYRKSGFVLAHENIRYGGLKPGGYAQLDLALNPLGPGDAKEVDRFEQRHHLFPASRRGFLQAWLGYEGMALRRGGEIAGYGVIRPCHEGFKLGPLFADTVADAETILRGLLTRAPEGMIFLDTPGTNPAAIDLAVSLGFQPMFETARMYRGSTPALDTAKVFGITTFELG
ncbi:GNAT family N-acetyltransferase [Aestuariivirga sp.]|uniref:GNAT family N-acetyltransferase n=1 Tax=Aestuariivirga sp. TaxID=2650926 RepID=UPI003BA85005